MKKIILAATLSLLFFIVGLVATYFALPAIAPDMVERTRLRLDSLEMAEAMADSLAQYTGLQDSMETSMSVMEPQEGLNDVIMSVRDSLQQINRLLESNRREKDVLLERIQQLEERWRAISGKYEEARELSSTIVKLEDDALAELLNQIDMDVLEAIYVEATPRNRARLLQMLPAEKAAYVVNKMASPQPFVGETRNQQQDNNP